MKTLVLGLGNTILSDDGVGIHIAEYIKDRCKNTEVLEASAAGFRVVDEMIGYNKLILIDSIITNKSTPGTLHILDPDDFSKTAHYTSPHDISLFEAFRIVKEQDYQLPEEIMIYAVEVADVETLSEQCTEEVQQAIPAIAERIIEENKLKVVIDREYRLEDIVEAHRYVDSERKRGNVIVTVIKNSMV